MRPPITVIQMMFWVIASPWVILAYSNHGKKYQNMLLNKPV